MKTLVAYTTKHGATRKYAEALAKELPGEVTLVDLRQNQECDLAPYDTVILGGAVYYGQVQKAVRSFCERNLEALKEKRLGLFTCGMFEGEQAERQLQDAFPGELRETALVKAPLGGAVNLAGLTFFERLVSRVVGLKESVDHYSAGAAREFAGALR